MATFSQIDFGFNIWSQLLNVGGLIAVLLAFAVFILWNKLTDKENALASLNAQIKEDAKESIKIVTSMEALIDRMLSEQSNGEKRILESVKSEANTIKDILREYRAHITENAKRNVD